MYTVAIDFPKVKITGKYAPLFQAFLIKRKIKITSLIGEAQPDVVWIGLGAPKQEIWAIEHHKYCKNVKIIAGIGAVFDFYSGNISRAPDWIRSIGLEWFYRGVAAPRQLWRRNISSIPIFVVIILENWRLVITRMFQRYGSRRAPNLFLVGVARSGTTTVAEWLNSHSDILVTAK